MFSPLKICLAAATALLLTAGAAQAETRVIGAGATFPKPLYLKWISAVNEKNADVKFDYTGGGSGAGIKAITDRTADFAGSDAPLSEKQLTAAPAKLLHVPTVAGPVVITYNLPGLKTLKLDGETIAGIYTGKIKTWNDAKLAALNAGQELPATPITVVHRSDPSGTSNIFTTYLSSVSEIWKEKVGAGIDVKWPKGEAGRGNDGVASTVKNTSGSVGYVELAYAKSQNLPFATLVNKDGKDVVPSVEGVNAAAANVKDIPENLILNINNAPGADSYPIAGFTYILVYQDLSYFKDKAKAQALVNFLNWAATDGQKLANENGYAKLPEDLQKKVVEEIKTITFDGEALLK